MIIISINEKNVEIKDCRKIWSWIGANSVEQIALEGVSETSKITQSVQVILLTDAIQVLPCTDLSINKIEAISEWKQ